ncbi:MAG: hypothetical protein ACOCV2_05485 [Persicimonas sp.]
MRIRIAILALVLVTGVAFGLFGCKAEECRQMMQCCDEIEGEEGVGGACGEMAEGERDPDTCRTVLETARAMFEERGESPPEECR